jgi:hypothetical protein
MSTIQAGHPEASSRPYYQNTRKCPACGDRLVAAEWSDLVNERCVRHLWCCDGCGYQFATAVTLTDGA